MTTSTAAPALVDVDLDVNPVPLQRAGRNIDDRRAYLEKRSREFRDEFRIMLRATGQVPRSPIGDEVLLEVLFWRRCTSAANRGDLTNLLKAIEDACNPSRDGGWLGVWHDDRQVVKLYGRIVESGPNVKGRIQMRITAAIGGDQ